MTFCPEVVRVSSRCKCTARTVRSQLLDGSYFAVLSPRISDDRLLQRPQSRIGPSNLVCVRPATETCAAGSPQFLKAARVASRRATSNFYRPIRRYSREWAGLFLCAVLHHLQAEKRTHRGKARPDCSAGFLQASDEGLLQGVLVASAP